MILREIVVSMRPGQWIKNLFVFAAPVFGQAMARPSAWLRTASAFAVFCLLSGAYYLFNDILDAPRDRLHPRKAGRPVAAGRLSPRSAFAAALILALAGLAASIYLGRDFLIVAVAYVILQAAYSLGLKSVVIIDIFALSAGYVLRVLGGGAVTGVVSSAWLLVCTTLIALLLALGKRRHELLCLEGEAARHRPVLEAYGSLLLDQMIAVVTAATVVGYLLYAMSESTLQRFPSASLLWTAPFALYGIFRYLYLVYRKGEGGNPEEMVVKDIPLLLSILLWGGCAALIIYRL